MYKLKSRSYILLRISVILQERHKLIKISLICVESSDIRRIKIKDHEMNIRDLFLKPLLVHTQKASTNRDMLRNKIILNLLPAIVNM